MSKIFNFHQVSDATWFQNVIVYLKGRYKLVDIDGLSDRYFNRNDVDDGICHITVDDGHISFYENIFPILKKHKVPATLFVSPKVCKDNINFWFQEIEGYDTDKILRIVSSEMNVDVHKIRPYSIESVLKTMPVNKIIDIIKLYQRQHSVPEKRYQNMSLDQLKEVRDSALVEIGAHTVNHPILKNETDADFRDEIYNSIKDLGLLGFPVRYFAFPNGIPGLDFSNRETNFLREIGIRMAFSTEAREISASGEAMSVPRFCISDYERLPFLKTKILFANTWNQLKRAKPNGEFRERRRLIEIFSNRAA